jgi:hypothetical protein
MTKTQKSIAGLGLALVCGAVLKSAISRSEKASAAIVEPGAAALAQNDSKPAETSGRGVSAASPTPALAEVAEKIGSGPDGKEVIPTDGKETLPPVAEFVSSDRPQAVDPAHGGAPTEFLNPSPTPQFLAPPNPQSVAGPVVSQEAR